MSDHEKPLPPTIYALAYRRRGTSAWMLDKSGSQKLMKIMKTTNEMSLHYKDLEWDIKPYHLRESWVVRLWGGVK